MLPQKQRIHSSKEVLTVLKKGIKCRYNSLTLFYLPQTIQGIRATVIVDKKVSKLAVRRNRLKRQLRALLQTHSLRPGLYIVRGYPGAEKLSFEGLSAEWQQLLRRQP